MWVSGELLSILRKVIRVGIWSTLCVSILKGDVFAQDKELSKWQHAKYQGLQIGISKETEVMRVLGKPQWTGKEEDTGTPMTTYLVTEPKPGFLYVYLDKGVLRGLTLGLKDTLTKYEVIKMFGTDFNIVHYDFDDCLATDGSAPVYRSPNGSVIDMEYPSLGIAINISSGLATEISYTDRPHGPGKSRCAVRSRKK